MTCTGERLCWLAGQTGWSGIMQRCRVVGIILMSFTTASAGLTQELPKLLEKRLAGLPSVAKKNARNECQSLLKSIDESEVVALGLRAKKLDRLRYICSRKLTWTDSLVALIAERAVVRRRALETEEPAALCRALRDLGLAYHYLAYNDRALDRYTEAVDIAIRWKGRGTTEEDIAGAQESLSTMLSDRREFQLALDIANQSLQLRRQALRLHPEKVVTSLTERARIEEQKGDFEAAEKTLREAQQLSLEHGLEQSPEASRVANNLGEILYRLGDLTGAIESLEKAEDLRLHPPRPRQPERQVASTHSLLGQVFYDFGDYLKAIDYYRKSVQEHLDWVGKDAYRYCDAITGLATVLEASGKWQEALAWQSEALAIRTKAVRASAAASDQQANIELRLMKARSLTRLGALQRRMGATGALRSLEQARMIEDGVLADDPNIDRAQTLFELANYWREAGNHQRARSFIDRCLKELNGLREGSPLLLQATEVAAQVAVNPVAGLQILEQASRIADQLYGESNPGKASILQVRADLRWRQRDTAGALDDALLSQKLSLPHVRSIVEAFPRDQALVFAADRRRSLDLALELAAENPDLKPDTVRQIFEMAASSRMLVRDAEIERQRLVGAKTNPKLATVAKRLASARERFAYLLVQAQGTIKTQADYLQEAQQELTDAEAELATKAQPFLASRLIPEVSVQQLRQKLSAGTALVAIFEYQRIAGGEAYIAFVLNGSAPVRAVAVGETAAIDKLVKQWRNAILSFRNPVEARTRAGQALRRTIWDPIVRWLAGSKTVFVVPDGSLYLVPLMALPSEGRGYLIEQGWAFHNLTAERDLLESADPLQPIPGSWLAVGGVDYNRSKGPSITAVTSSLAVLRGSNSAKRSPEAPRAGSCQRNGLSVFGSLPGSRAEVQDLATLWQQLQFRPAKSAPALTTLMGQDATEQALRRAVHGQRIVHLATHGFAFADRCDWAQSKIRGIGGLSLSARPDSTEPPPVSGLALAGANDWGRAMSSDQDGILTEEEILDLDLRTADWVVLSSCDSGLGSIRPGEGVVGILRAFQVAGAKSVIVSLWSVEDRAAQRWMHELYQARFRQHLSTIQSVRQAALSSMLYYRKQGDDNPAKWAGFVANGYWD